MRCEQGDGDDVGGGGSDDVHHGLALNMRSPIEVVALLCEVKAPLRAQLHSKKWYSWCRAGKINCLRVIFHLVPTLLSPSSSPPSAIARYSLYRVEGRETRGTYYVW